MPERMIPTLCSWCQGDGEVREFPWGCVFSYYILILHSQIAVRMMAPDERADLPICPASRQATGIIPDEYVCNITRI